MRIFSCESKTCAKKRIHERGSDGRKTKAIIETEYEIIETLSKGYAIQRLCDEFGVSKSGYYAWRTRKGTPNRYERLRRELKRRIQALHEIHPQVGYHHLAGLLRKETSLRFSDWLVHRCCKDMGIRSIARKRNPFRRKDEHMVYPNLLTDRTATRPFEKVCTDTTLLKHRGKGYDWNLYLDVFNNEIVGSDVRLSKSGHGAKNHFMALSRFLELRHQRGFDDQPTIVHSDQGAIYSSMAFHDRLPSNVIQSMSRAATPTDNPVMEAINGWIKDDLRYEFHLESAKDIHALIRRYIDYYNKVRLGYALQYKSPIQYRTELDYR